MKRKLFIISSLFLFLTMGPVFALNGLDIFIKASPSMILNTLDKEHSAPSPVKVLPGIGVKIPNNTFINFQPSLEYYGSYELWYDGKALPAEIENRTAITQNFLLTLPVMVNFQLGKGKAFGVVQQVDVGGGPAILMRFAGLAHGVSENDTGFTGSAASDKEAISKYFWEKGRFLYLNVQADWLFTYADAGISAGPALAVNLPLGSLMAKEGLNNIIISVAGKIVF